MSVIDLQRNAERLKWFTTEELLAEIGRREPQTCARCGEQFPAYAAHYCGQRKELPKGTSI